MNLDLTGTSALVTGGTAGIGNAAATELAALGATVTITYANNVERAEQAAADLGDRCHLQRSDSSSAEASADLVQRVIDDVGRLDVVVANAGETARSPIGATADDVYDRVFDANVRGVWALLEAASPHLGRADGSFSCRASARR